MGWLLVAALALIAVAGWCASAETALLRVSRAGAKELGRSPGADGGPLQAVLAEVSRYLVVLALVRVAGEISATVLVTAVLVRWITPDWWAFLVAAVIMITVCFVIAAVIPRRIGRQHVVRVASAAASVLRPVVRLLGPLPRLLLATGGGPAGEQQGRRVWLRGGAARPGGPAGAAADHPARRAGHDPLGVRAGRHHRPRGHGAPHRHGLRGARQDRTAGAVAGAAQRVLPDSRWSGRTWTMSSASPTSRTWSPAATSTGRASPSRRSTR